MIILDTDVLIDLGRYELNPAERFGASILSRAELEFGMQAAKSAEESQQRTARLMSLDARFDWIPFDLESTRSYGFLAARATASGATVRSKDALIAAQAHRHSAAVMTANLTDFRPFERLVAVLAPEPKSR